MLCTAMSPLIHACDAWFTASFRTIHVCSEQSLLKCGLQCVIGTGRSSCLLWRKWDTMMKISVVEELTMLLYPISAVVPCRFSLKHERMSRSMRGQGVLILWECGTVLRPAWAPYWCLCAIDYCFSLMCAVQWRHCRRVLIQSLHVGIIGKCRRSLMCTKFSTFEFFYRYHCARTIADAWLHILILLFFRWTRNW